MVNSDENDYTDEWHCRHGTYMGPDLDGSPPYCPQCKSESGNSKMSTEEIRINLANKSLKEILLNLSSISPEKIRINWARLFWAFIILLILIVVCTQLW